jgi:hypothetical protein
MTDDRSQSSLGITARDFCAPDASDLKQVSSLRPSTRSTIMSFAMSTCTMTMVSRRLFSSRTSCLLVGTNIGGATSQHQPSRTT